MWKAGYQARVELDEEAGVFHGEVINTRDVSTFQGSSVDELKQAFEDSVDDYLEFCASRGEDPEKPFSGKFLVRVPPEVHREIMTKARRQGKSRPQKKMVCPTKGPRTLRRSLSVADHAQLLHAFLRLAHNVGRGNLRQQPFPVLAHGFRRGNLRLPAQCAKAG